MAKKIIPAYTVAEAQRELGASLASVYSWLNTGVLDEIGVVFGNVRLVSVKSVEALKAKRQTGKRG